MLTLFIIFVLLISAAVQVAIQCIAWLIMYLIVRYYEKEV